MARLSTLLFLVFPLALALLVNLRNFSIWTQHVESLLEDSWPHAAVQNADLTVRALQKFRQISQSVVQLASLGGYFSMGISSEKTHFRVLQTFRPEYSSGQITQYESQRTGMRVIVVDQEGPKLYGFFVLATEIHDDSG